MSRATRGAAFERQVQDHLQALNWYVTRAAGSHGCADLVAIAPNEVAFVQAKLGGPGAFRPVEWNELYEVARAYGGVAILVHRPKRGRLEFLQLLDRKQDNGVRGPAAPCEAWMPWRVAKESNAH